MTVDPLRFPLDDRAYRAADHSWLDELDHHTVHAGLPHQRMGTRGITEAEWLVFDEHLPSELALRRRLLAEARDEVLATTEGSEAAVAETETTVTDWLARHRPGALSAIDHSEPDPLARAAGAVSEDLCLMEGRAEGWRLTAAALCFPTYWRLGEKIGRPQAAVHGPVPHYAQDLEARVSTFFDRLRPGRIVTRRNWGFSPHLLLFVPDLRAVPRPESYDLDDLWLRSERQTLRKLPGSGAVLFTIKVQLAPAREIERRPDLAARLLEAMRSWSPELIESRGGRHGWYDEVCGWLAATTGGRPGVR